MPKPAVSRAELLQAIISNEQELPDEVIQSLGFAPVVRETQLKSDSNLQVNVEVVEAKITESQTDNTLPLAPVTFWQPIALKQEDIAVKVKEQKKISVKMPAREENSKRPQYAFLAEFNQLIPRIHKVLSQLHPSKNYDIDKIIQHISQGEYLSRLPRQYRPGWGGSLYVIEDRSDYLAPYVRDQAMVFEHLKEIYSHTGFFAAIINEYYPWPLLSDSEDDEQKIDPMPGDQILILSDLGSLAHDGGKASEFWLEFGHQMQANGVNLIALLPCHAMECPASLSPFYQLLSWEHPAPSILSLSELEQKGENLLTHLSSTTRIEPGLLRDIRLILGVDQYPARLESWVWQNVGNYNLLGASFDKEAREPFFHALENDSNHQRKTLRLTQQWMHYLPYELWLESVLKLGDWAKQSDDATGDLAIISDKEQNDAQTLVHHLASRFDQEGLYSFSARGWIWLEDFMDNIYAQAKQNPDLEIPLRTLKKAIQQQQTGITSEEIIEAEIERFNIYHHANQLIFQPAQQDPIANSITNASPIAQIESEDGFIQIEPQFWLDGIPPSWAVDWGYDNYGPWVVFEIKSCCQKMRWIPPGEFLMGSPEDESGRYDDEGPQHPVTIKEGYWLFDTPVTQALWQVVMGDNPSEFKSPQRPVENVSWDDAQEFIQVINRLIPDLQLCLPSEAQWEYACRAGTTTAIYTGEMEILGERNAPALDGIAWYGGNSGVGFELDNAWDSSDWPEKQESHTSAGTHPVAQKQANPWGLYDMLGNVWEWTEDHWHKGYDGAPGNGSAWKSAKEVQRVLRGGSWISSARYCRSAAHYWYSPVSAYDFTGFRCALVQKEPGQVAQPAYSGVLSQAELEGRGNQRGEAVQLSAQTSGIILNGGLSQAQLLSIRSDKNRIVLEKNILPSWASAMGRDQYGLWAEFSLEGEQGEIIQRMRWIPPGQFLMGAPEKEKGRLNNERPQHLVTLSKGFWLFDTTVSQALWQEVMNNNPSRLKRRNLPVENVSWNDCQIFLKTINTKFPRLNLSLPNEAQWEYACRAGTTTAFNLGDQVNHDDVNFYSTIIYQGTDNARKNSLPAKELSINQWGLFQMHGNVKEWCLDGRRTYTRNSEIDPLGSTKLFSNRIMRGGSWNVSDLSCRSSAREVQPPTKRSSVFSFRCIREE